MKEIYEIINNFLDDEDNKDIYCDDKVKHIKEYILSKIIFLSLLSSAPAWAGRCAAGGNCRLLPPMTMLCSPPLRRGAVNSPGSMR